nr:NADH dehydrogenase subunit 2 [Peloridium hammoniorum]
MKHNSSNLLFLLMLIMSLLLILGSNNWLCIWVGLEINLISFLPLLLSSESNLKSTSGMKYFLIQSLGSIFLLVSIFSYLFYINTTKVFQDILMTLSMMIKLGSSPFHFWLPSIMENLGWLNCFIILTLQKLGPLLILSQLMYSGFYFYYICMNLIVGALGSLNQSSLRKLLAYSSINHLGWILLGMTEGMNCWFIYFLVYTLTNLSLIMILYSVNVFYLHQCFYSFMKPIQKINLSINFLSLGGMPPFIGFLPKWMILEELFNTQYSFLLILLIWSSLMSIFFYLRIAFSLLFMYSSFMKMNSSIYQDNKFVEVGLMHLILIPLLTVMV